ncbi:glycoside hydrolase family 95 protein [Paenibacillus qinlingensis]|uniref:Alpha-L-fucosidase 2 n=1 Tax=Paenibacillus qinlingensis TaxID=1837343 RepID=A0ABU1NW81_9BACL|nr:glycoside hydrolase family 95 protein [Paenibacillus qinlingensis]MDR6551690.1 alpha-L-fucosidase 2 [Paenibacillus qinlingensis]
MNEMKLWYDRPASNWSQGLPIGNGRLGAMIYGGVGHETWSLTELTYWSGKPESLSGSSKGRADLDQMREHFFAGDYRRGDELAKQSLQPKKGNFGTHLSMCDVQFTFEQPGDQLVRELDLQSACTQTVYTSGGHRQTREVWASHPDGIVAARLFSEQSGGLSLTLRILGRTERFTATLVDKETFVFEGQATERMHSNGECGVSCQGVLKVITHGGSVTADAATGQIKIDRADDVVIYLAANTNYGSNDDEWMSKSLLQIENAIAKGYERLRADHVADYQRLYDNVNLDLGVSKNSSLPTDKRIELFLQGRDDDPHLFALFYQYGRYLTIAGSRADSPLPLNLQGIWNDGEANRMQWSCDYHLDINTQMNYFPAEVSNLAECHLPLMRFVSQLAGSGRAAAKHFYGCEGWVAHVFTNAWGFASPGWETSWGLNVTGGLWIATHLREHYEFGLDQTFLAETAYPVLKEAAAFFLDYMTVHPQYGWLVTGPSNSPENSFYIDDPQRSEYQLSMGSTLDQVLVRDLFAFCLEASELLQVDMELQQELKTAIALLPPLMIGRRGQLQEWLEDYEEAQPDHRHLSHLFSLYPGNQVTPEGTPELSAAARVTLENRMDRETLEDVEFTLAALAANFARLQDGENAYKHLTHLIGHLCFNNLLTYSKAGIAGAETNICVVDGNFGGTAAIAEMLLQSHAGSIHLLPALPAKWHTGKVTGLRVKGNAEVDVTWANCELVEARIHAYSAVHTSIRYGEHKVEMALEPNCTYQIDRKLNINLI